MKIKKLPSKRVIKQKIKTLRHDLHETRPALCRVFIHRWKKWTRPKEMVLNTDTMFEQQIRYQERRCRDCGQIQERVL